MPRLTTMIEMDAEMLKAVEVRAERMGKTVSVVIEDAVRQSLALSLFERMWSASDMSESEAANLALEAQGQTRSRLQ